VINNELIGTRLSRDIMTIGHYRPSVSVQRFVAAVAVFAAQRKLSLLVCW
jgi:hypothetical protein